MTIKTIFTFDLERGYQPNDINNYCSVIRKLASTYTWDHEIRQETLKNTHDEWIRLQYQESYNHLLYDYLYNFHFDSGWENTLSVFFEMPENLMEWYNKYKIPYLNFMTSKIRFQGLEDTIMVESNLDIGPNITNDELKKNIPHYYYYNRDEDSYKPFIGKTIALGQMYGDRSVIFDGKSHSIFDYEFKADIYRPHPHTILHQPKYNEEQIKLAKERGLEVITHGNIYQILHSCKKVIAISSSSLYEAQLMNKEVQFLNEKEYIKKGKMIWWKDINKKFWERIRSQL